MAQKESQGMFSRYSGEQVQQFPPGYAEAMASVGQAYANIGAQIGGAMVKRSELELKSKEVSAAEQKNKLTERALEGKENTSAVGDFEKAAKILQGSLDSIDGEIGPIERDIREGKYKNELEIKAAQEKISSLREQRGSLAARLHKISEKAASYVELLPGANRRGSETSPILNAPRSYNGITPLPGTQIREGKLGEGTSLIDAPFSGFGGPIDLTNGVDINNITGQPRSDNRGFIPQNYLNNGSSYNNTGTGVVSTYAPNGIGGAQKKVVVQDGRVHSVISQSGNVKQISGFIPEQSINAVEEYASAGSEQQVSDDAANTDAGTSPVEQAMPAPLKQTMYRIPAEGLPAHPNSGNETGKVHGTIEFVDGKPQVKFNWDLLDETKVGKPGVEGSKMSLRKLSMMNWILQNSQEQEVEVVTDEEMAAARKLYQTADNSDDMYRIAQAYALATRDTAGTDSPESNRFGLRFHDEFDYWPTEFLVKGEVDNTKLIVPSVKVLNEENVAGVLGKVRAAEEELATVSTRPGDLEKDDPSIPKIRKLKEKRDFALATFQGTGSKKQKDDALKEIDALDKELVYYEQESKVYQSRVQQWQDSIKAATAKIEAAKGPITTQKTLSEIESNEQHSAKVASATIRNFFPSTGKEIMKYGGWMPAKLQKIRGFAEAVKDSLGRNYKWSLSPAEAVDSLYRNNQWKELEKISAMLPTEDQWKAIDIAHRSAIGSIVPLQKLKSENDKLVSSWLGAGGVMHTQYKKLTSNEIADAETMRAAIIKDIRVALVGPGNPSNYEQEILRTIVPDPKEFFSNPQRNKIRLKALTLLVILNHAANMKYNGMDNPDNSVYQWYTQQFGDVLGDTIDAKTFNNIYEDYSRSATRYKSNEGAQRTTDVASSFGEALMKRLEEADIAKEKSAKPATKK